MKLLLAILLLASPLFASIVGAQGMGDFKLANPAQCEAGAIKGPHRLGNCFHA
jgi:hypothetical protein